MKINENLKQMFKWVGEMQKAQREQHSSFKDTTLRARQTWANKAGNSCKHIFKYIRLNWIKFPLTDTLLILGWFLWALTSEKFWILASYLTAQFLKHCIWIPANQTADNL